MYFCSIDTRVCSLRVNMCLASICYAMNNSVLIMWCCRSPRGAGVRGARKNAHHTWSLISLQSNVDLLRPSLRPWVDEMDPYFRFHLLGTFKKATLVAAWFTWLFLVHQQNSTRGNFQFLLEIRLKDIFSVPAWNQINTKLKRYLVTGCDLHAHSLSIRDRVRITYQLMINVPLFLHFCRRLYEKHSKRNLCSFCDAKVS